MGMPAARMFDICSGHSCYPPRPNRDGSHNVLINGRSAHRVGDPWFSHHCHHHTHDGITVTGSGTVFVNGQPLARVGDQVSCGSVIMTGSENCICG
jgi:uncharacterized Zn-binding protein involved in type VI secretion